MVVVALAMGYGDKVYEGGSEPEESGSVAIVTRSSRVQVEAERSTMLLAEGCI